MIKLKINLDDETIDLPSNYQWGESCYLDPKDFGNYSLNDILNFGFNSEWIFRDSVRKVYLKHLGSDNYTLITEGTKKNKYFSLLSCLDLENLYIDNIDSSELEYNFTRYSYQKTFHGKIKNLYIKELKDIESNVYFNKQIDNLFINNKLVNYIEMEFDDYRFIHETFLRFESIKYVIFRKSVIETFISTNTYFYSWFMDSLLKNKIIIFEGTYAEFRKVYQSWYKANATVIIPSDKNEYQAKTNKIIKVKNLDFKNLDFGMIELLLESQR